MANVDRSGAGTREMPRIAEVMTRGPVSISLDETVRQATDMMIDNQVRHLPVTDSNFLVGILSDRDVAFADNPKEPDLAERLLVRDVCCLDVYTAAADTPLDEVLAEMAERRIGSVVIVERDEIAGLFTATDACRCFADHLRGQPTT